MSGNGLLPWPIKRQRNERPEFRLAPVRGHDGGDAFRPDRRIIVQAVRTRWEKPHRPRRRGELGHEYGSYSLSGLGRRHNRLGGLRSGLSALRKQN
jgi:hypothetical protein